MKPSSSKKNTATPQKQQQQNPRKRPSSNSTSSSSEELALKAFLHHEFGYEKEAKSRKISNDVDVMKEEELKQLSNDVLNQNSKNGLKECEDFDKLGDLESVVCHLNSRITGSYQIPASFIPRAFNFSILDHLKFLLPTVKKEIQEKKQQEIKKPLKQPSRKTKMAITSNKIQTITNPPPKSDKQKARKLKRALNEIIKKRETRLGTFGVMPYELLLQIFSYLDWKMLHKSITLVCKDWNDSVSKYERYIISSWHHFDFFTTYCEGDFNIESMEQFLIKIEDKPNTPLLTCIVENALLDYCNLNEHIIQPLLDDPDGEKVENNNTVINDCGLTSAILTPKVLDYIVPKVFPNVKYLTGKGLNGYLINIFKSNVKFIDLRLPDIPPLSSFGPFPKLEYLQVLDNRWRESTEHMKNLQPLFENVKYLVLGVPLAPNFFTTVFEKGCSLRTVTFNFMYNLQVLDFCRAIEPFMKNIDPNNESMGLRKIAFPDSSLTKDAVSALGSSVGHLLRVLQLNRIDSIDDGLKNFQILEELSITNSKLRPSFVDHIISCPFGPNLKVLNLRGSNFNFSSIQPSIRNMQITGAIVSGISGNTYSADAAKRDRIIDFKQDLVKILNWMIPYGVDMQKLNAIDLKLVLTDYGEFYFQRNNKRNHPNRYVWRNRLPPNETVTVIRNRNGTCYWEKI